MHFFFFETLIQPKAVAEKLPVIAFENDVATIEGEIFSVAHQAIYIDIIVSPFFEAVGVEVDKNAVDLLCFCGG